jgi:hypothetical protein
MRRYIMNTLQNKSSGVPGSRRSSLKRTLLVRFKLVLCTVLLILAIGNQKIFGQGVGISELAPITPHASSILELQSTTKGFLAPRMSTAQRTGLASPAPGLLVYDTDTKSFWYYDSGWKAFASEAWGTANQLLGMNNAGNANEYKTLQGTANRVIVTFTPGLITLSTPQDIAPISSPTFAGLTLTSPLTVPNGGTGLTSGISGGIPYFNTSTSMASSALLTANGVVIGGGAGIAPATITPGTNNTVLRGSTGGAPSFGQIVNSDIAAGTIDLTSKVTGILPLANGGTNANLTASASNGGIVWSNASQMQILAGTATANKILLSGVSSSPAWSSYTIPFSFAGAGEVLYTSNATTLSSLPAGTAGMYLKSNGSAAPAWQRISLSSASEVMNILPIANGGTNSSTILVNGRVMISRAGQIVEAGVMNNGQVIVGSTGFEPQIVTMGGDITIDNAGTTSIGTSKVLNGMLAANAVTTDKISDGTIMNADINASAAIDATKLIDGSVSNTELGYINTLTSNAQTQLNNLGTQIIGINSLADGKIYVGDVTNTAQEVFVTGDITMTDAGVTTISNSAVTTGKILDGTILNADIANNTIDLTQKVTGVLPVSHGGTNSSTALVNGRVMISKAGKIVEAGVMNNGQVIVGSTGLEPQIVTMGGDVSINNLGATTVGFVGTSTAANIHLAELLANASTDLNTPSTIVKRDASGNFTAGIITAALNGNASTVTTNANLTGDVTSIGNATTLATVNTTTPGTYGTGTTVPTITVNGKGLVTASSSIAIAFPVTLAGAETLTNKTIISPLGLVKGDVGLGNVDNTSDLSKPISTATQAALNFKEDLANKSLDVTTDGGSDVKYPSVKAIKNYVDAVIVTSTPDATALIKGKIKLAGDLSGTADLPTVATVGGSTALNIHSAELLANAATNLNTASAIVKRDGSGNFTAGTITAALNGNATTATSATSATTAGTANNLSGGAGGSIPYQSAASTTALLVNGTAGQVLTSNGTTLAPSWTNPTNGTVTSVGLSLPAFITVTSSPVTGSGTLTGTLVSQSANTVFAAPNGSAGAPTFRALVTTDIPNIAESQVTNLVTDLSNRALTSTTVNGHALSSNVLISASDITTGTLPHAQLPALVSGDIPNNAANTSGNAATATSLATRAIYGNNFNGTTDVTGIIASNYGGTGNGFTKFSGPAGAEKIFTLPNANATILTSNTAVTVVQGGTGATTLTSHGVMIGNGTSAVNVTGAGTAGQILQSGGAGSDPSWSTAIYPSTAGSAGSLLVSNGTNFTSTGLSTNTMALGSDVTLTLANTFYTGPSMSLGAGTWFITGTVTLYSTNGVMGSAAARLMNGATVITSSESYLRSGDNLTSITLSGFVTLAGSTTIFIEAAFNLTGGFIRANTVIGATTNASFMNAVRVGP